MSTQNGSGSTEPKRQPAVNFSRPALAYYWSVAGLAVALSVWALALLRPSSDQLGRFALLAVLAALAQLFIVDKPGANQAYRTAIVFLTAAALLLPAGLLVLLAPLHYLPSWIRRRKAWRISLFNVAKTTLATLSAWLAFHEVARHVHAVDGSTRFTLGGAVACAVFVGVDHLLLANMIRMTSSRSLRRTGLFAFESLSTDIVLAALGVATTAFWMDERWLTPFALAPLLIIHRAMYVPQLEEEAKVDAKTGLFNAKEFAHALHTEVARAKRFHRPLALIMADLDFLRTINNTHGHLAGDAVLTGIAEIFRDEVREYDVPSRFGGEEFSVLLPETDADGAFEIAERIRRAVEEREFRVETQAEPIRATVSIGVACFPIEAHDATSLIHAADVAVYRAKAEGRNRVCRWIHESELPESEERRPDISESPLGTSLRALEQTPA